MSIKIHTYHNTINYGALLQSLSLKTFIANSTDLKVSYDKYQPKKLIFVEIYRPLITKNFFKFQNTLKKNFRIYKWKIKANKEIENTLHKKNFKSNELSIYGSDEIWNFKNAYHGYDPIFFGSTNQNKKISYAASIGIAKYENLTNYQKIEIKENLKKFESISVRDRNSSDFVKKILDIEPQIVVDPTLLCTPKILEDISLVNFLEKEKYALIYGTVFSEKQKKQIHNFCERKNLKLISVGYLNKWVKINYLGLDPTNFYQLIKNADFVFTSMFHGIMFSVKLKKQFYYNVDPIRENKIQHFIKFLDLNSREIMEILDEKSLINYDEVYKILDKWIYESQNYLLNAINRHFIKT